MNSQLGAGAFLTPQSHRSSIPDYARNTAAHVETKAREREREREQTGMQSETTSYKKEYQARKTDP